MVCSFWCLGKRYQVPADLPHPIQTQYSATSVDLEMVVKMGEDTLVDSTAWGLGRTLDQRLWATAAAMKLEEVLDSQNFQIVY